MLLEASIGELGLLEFILIINEVFCATALVFVNIYFSQACVLLQY